jgi:hypothetical protein
VILYDIVEADYFNVLVLKVRDFTNEGWKPHRRPFTVKVPNDAVSPHATKIMWYQCVIKEVE